MVYILQVNVKYKARGSSYLFIAVFELIDQMICRSIILKNTEDKKHRKHWKDKKILVN